MMLSHIPTVQDYDTKTTALRCQTKMDGCRKLDGYKAAVTMFPDSAHAYFGSDKANTERVRTDTLALKPPS
jgi:hypothetical protein